MSEQPQTSSPPVVADNSKFVCDCGDYCRSACEGKPYGKFYKEYDGELYKEYKGKRYCVLHYPGVEKSAEFKAALEQKLAAKDFNFCGVWFPEKASFANFDFDADADFYYAVFSAEADFQKAKFGTSVSFAFAEFGADVNFRTANFKSDANFYGATFIGNADFRHAIFGANVYFNRTAFSAGADFSNVTLTSYFYFYGDAKRQVFSDKSSLNLSYARIEKPKRVSFQEVMLRPHWFVDTDSRDFEFVNVKWRGLDEGRRGFFKREIESLGYDVALSHRLLGIACRRLAINAEENNRYREASWFRYTAMDAQRKRHRRGFGFWTLDWWYWVVSGYGERAWQAFVVLLAIWLLFAFAYTQIGFVRWEPKLTNAQEAQTAQIDEVGKPLELKRAFHYSLDVMTLQKPDPKPATTTARLFVLLETILGPLQAALLALAVRRKFMR